MNAHDEHLTRMASTLNTRKSLRDMEAAARLREDRRNARFIRRVLIPVCLIILGAIGGYLGANAIHAADAPKPTAHAHAAAVTKPDITVPDCSVYAFTSHPVLPPYTRTDVCYTDNGDGSWTISTSAYNINLSENH